MNTFRISYVLAIITYFLTIPSAFSQSQSLITIEGQILNQYNNPLDVANVLLMPLNANSVIVSSITDKDGSFALSPQREITGDSLTIRVMRMGIKSKSFVIPNRSDKNLVLRVVEESFNLDELVVKNEKVKESGDTLTYNVSSFQSITDKSLADVLRKMPGISVEKGGKIRYQGEEISTLYIEGLNMLRGQYGIATNNIHPDDVASVEVLQNHQEIEALKEISSGERAAINIRLKESRKGVWTGRATLAAGIEGTQKGLWDGRLMASRFARNNQQLSLFKSNNIGTDINSELYSYDTYTRSLPSPIANINIGQASMLDDEYYRYNRDFSSSLNTLFKVGAKKTAGFNMTYAHIEDMPQLHEVSTHVFPSGEEVVFDEKSTGKFARNLWSGNIFYKANKPDYYLDTQLSFRMAHRKSEAVVVSEKLYNSRQRETPYQLGYNLEWLKLYDKNRLTITSENHYQNHSQDLTLNQSTQAVKEANAGSHTTIKISNYGSLIPRASLFLSLFYDYDTSSIELADHSVSQPSHIAGASMGMYYQHRGITLNLNMRLGYADKTLRCDDKSSHLRYADFTPFVSLKYVPIRNMAIHLDYNFIRRTPNIRMLHTFPILLGHRTSSSYEGELFLSSYHNIGSKITYKHVPSILFTALNVNYRRVAPHRLFGSYLRDNEIIMNTMPTTEYGEDLSISVSVSKGLYWKAMKIGVDVMGVKAEMPILIQNEVLRQNTTQWFVSADLYMRPWQFMEIKMDSKYNYISNKLENGIEQSPVQYWTNNIGLIFKPTERLHGYVGYHHYFNNDNQGDKHFHLCDLSVEYEFDRWSIYGRVNNLFDTQFYKYTTLSSVTRYDTMYQLRKRAILLGVQFKLL